MDEITKQRILKGDLDSYGDVVCANESMLLGYALRRLGDWRLAEEVVQLTFIRAYQKLSDFRPDEDFGVWLCVTCKFLILTELKKRSREARNQSNFREALENEMATAAANDMEPDFKRDQLVYLKRCLGELKSESANLIKLRYDDKRSCKEIAEEKNRTVTWVTSTLNRVRKALRDCIESQPGQETTSS